MPTNHTTIIEFDNWLTQIEGQNLEFKYGKEFILTKAKICRTIVQPWLMKAAAS